MTDVRQCRQSGTNPDDWFAPHGSERARRASTLCMHCPLYWECQGYALENGIPWGIWGGMDERERERIWDRTGGRPKLFDESLDVDLGPWKPRDYVDEWKEATAA